MYLHTFVTTHLGPNYLCLTHLKWTLFLPPTFSHPLILQYWFTPWPWNWGHANVCMTWRSSRNHHRFVRPAACSFTWGRNEWFWRRGGRNALHPPVVLLISIHPDKVRRRLWEKCFVCYHQMFGCFWNEEMPAYRRGWTTSSYGSTTTRVTSS